MKKIIFLFAIMMAASLVTFAQSDLDKGERRMNFGTGFSNYGVPLYFGMDFGVYPDITAGFVASVRSDNNHFIMGASAVGNYHFNTLLELDSEWDVYAGLSLGFVFWNYDNKLINQPSPLGLDLQIGGRYYWDETWAVNLELGGGSAFSGTRIGVTYKL